MRCYIFIYLRSKASRLELAFDFSTLSLLAGKKAFLCTKGKGEVCRHEFIMLPGDGDFVENQGCSAMLTKASPLYEQTILLIHDCDQIILSLLS